MANILITGGTGMIGSALAEALTTKGHRVIILTRKARPSSGNVVYKEWDIEKGAIDEGAIGEADAIIHLAGANVAEKRWTDKRKKEIVDSRVKSGELLVKSMQNIPNKIKTVVSASAIGWYGPDPLVPNPKPFVEANPAHNDFLGQTCVQWERSIEPVTGLGKRLVILRTGIVLSCEGGAYAEFRKPIKFGAAAILGNGKQIVSWIQIDDLVGIYVKAIEDESLQGVYNAVAPQPVSNKALVMEIRKQKGGFSVPVYAPAFALKLALGEMSVEVLKSATVSAEKVSNAGFLFRYPQIKEAVKNLEGES